MSQMTPATPIGTISTYTFQNSEGKATEVLLIPLKAAELGRDNAYPPPELDAESFGNWARGGYFFMNGECIAQLPRNASDLPLDQNASQVTDVMYRDGALEVYYPVNRDNAVCLTWEFTEDAWSAEYADCEVHDGSVKPSSVGLDATTVLWSINPEKYTE